MTGVTGVWSCCTKTPRKDKLVWRCLITAILEITLKAANYVNDPGEPF